MLNVHLHRWELKFWRLESSTSTSQVGIAVLVVEKLNFHFTDGICGFGGWEARVSHRRRKMRHQEMSWMFRSPELILSTQLSCWEKPGFKQGWGWNPQCCSWPSKRWSKDAEPWRERQWGPSRVENMGHTAKNFGFWSYCSRGIIQERSSLSFGRNKDEAPWDPLGSLEFPAGLVLDPCK